MRMMKIGALCACLALVAACSKEQNQPTKVTLDSMAIAAEANGSNNGDIAEKLALAGEQLLTPLAFMYADVVFDKALEIDPKNNRARFYKAVLKPVMSLRGSLARVKPLIDISDEQTKQDYKRNLEYLPNSGLRTFLLDGANDIVDEKTAQDFLANFRNALNDLRLFLKDNKDIKLTLNLNVMQWEQRWQETLQQVAQECPVQEVRPGVYEFVNCTSFAKVMQIDVAKADLEILQHAVAGYQIYASIFTSYDATGAISVGSAQPLTQKQTVIFLKSVADFGKLRKDHQLDVVLNMGTDLVAGVRWAVGIQNEICPNGSNHPKNRPGFLFKEGVCIKRTTPEGQSVEEILRTVESAIAGQTFKTVVTGQGVYQGQQYDTTVNAASILKNPIQDLKSVMPTKFDKCGNATNVGDETLGGVFPKGDATTVLTVRQEIGTPCYPWQF